MAVLGEIVELLRRWDRWKRLEDAPDRIDALEKRVEALEMKPPAISGPAKTGEQCPFCLNDTLRLKEVKPDPTFGMLGVEQQLFVCEKCGKERTVQADPNQTLSGPSSRRR